MGLLTDIRSGKRGGNGAGAVVFWIAVGAAFGFGAMQILSSVPRESWLYPLMLAGGLLGAVVGFYAAWGTSRLARILAIPGFIVELIK